MRELTRPGEALPPLLLAAAAELLLAAPPDPLLALVFEPLADAAVALFLFPLLPAKAGGRPP